MSSSIRINIRQKEIATPTIANISKEIFEMYRLTIGQGVSHELQLFVIFFFLKINDGKDNLLNILLRGGIKKLLKFNQALDNALSGTNGYLAKGDYATLKDEYQVTNILKYDVIFLIIDCIIHRDDIKHLAIGIFSDKDIGEIEKIKNTYGKSLEMFLLDFQNKKIQDDRYDDDGEYIDLSKSIHRPVYMRLSKNISMPLQKDTRFLKLTSNSPLALEIIQNIDIHFIVYLWQHLNLFDYIKLLDPVSIDFIHQLSGTVTKNISFDLNIRDIIILLVSTHIANTKSRVEKLENKKQMETLELLLLKHNSEYKNLLKIIENRILNSKGNLENRIANTEVKITALAGSIQTKTVKREIKKLENELLKLKNLEIDIVKDD